MTTKEHRNLARRLAVRGIEAYKQKLIYEEDLLNQSQDPNEVIKQFTKNRY